MLSWKIGQSCTLSDRLLLGAHLGEHVVDQAELLGLLGGEVAVAFGLGLDDLERPAGVPGQDLVEALLLA